MPALALFSLDFSWESCAVKAGLKADYTAQLSQLKSELNSASADTRSDVYTRCEAVEAMGKLVQDACFLAPEMLNLFLEAFKDHNGRVRYAAALALGELVKAEPSLAPKALEALVKAAAASRTMIHSLESPAAL
ncbi:MAG: HEAT repeat domain-containing protein, partial [Bacteroidota bacterium]